jgi:hypothetical protein
MKSCCQPLNFIGLFCEELEILKIMIVDHRIMSIILEPEEDRPKNSNKKAPA